MLSNQNTVWQPPRMRIPRRDAKRVQAFANMRQQETHIRPQRDIIEELWARRIAH